jgi:murein DD-endopeptidase MepM/ murein hydrolase activator NlpD
MTEEPRRNIATAPIFIDGVRVGTITCGDARDVSPDPLGNNFAFGPAPSPSAFPQRFANREMPGRSLGGDHGPSHATAPHRAEKHGPTFRPGTTPRGSAEPAKPHKETLQEVHKAVEGHEPEKPKHFDLKDVQSAAKGGTPGGVDRSSIAKELEGNEALQRRYAQMVVGEIYYDRASERAKIVQAETAANRALKRGHSLEQALWLHGGGRDRLGGVGHGESGYYPASPFNRGMTEAQYQDFKTNILPKVLAGSDEAKGFTGNASADVAEHQRAKGTPTFDLRSEGGDQYFDEDRNATLPRLPGKPVGVESLSRNLPQGVTRLGAATPTNFPSHVVGKLGLVDPITGTSLGGGPGESRGNHAHQGLDILAPAGSPIYAAGGGTIMSHNPRGSIQGDAFTYIKLDNGMTVAYGHHQLDPNLKAGSRVEAGQQIGTSGTANSVPHLHFETWGGKPHQSPLYDPRQVFGWNRNNLPRGGQGARTNPPEPPAKTASEVHGTAL